MADITPKQSLLETLGMPDPWDEDYQHLEFEPHGWFPKSGQTMLDRLCRQLHPSVIIEVGSWMGKSTRFLADRCDLVVAVDHWLGSKEHQEAHKEKLPTLFDQFLSNCERHRDKIVPLRMTSDEAAKLPLPEADLIYLDGSHEYDQVKADIENYYGFLATPGVMCGDDYQRDCGRGQVIARAVHGFADRERLLVGVKVPIWWYVRNDAALTLGVGVKA